MDKWEFRFKNWKNKKEKSPIEKKISEENKKILNEYGKKETAEIGEAGQKNVYDIREIMERRRIVIIAIIIFLILLFGILTSLGK